MKQCRSAFKQEYDIAKWLFFSLIKSSTGGARAYRLDLPLQTIARKVDLEMRMCCGVLLVSTGRIQELVLFQIT